MNNETPEQVIKKIKKPLRLTFRHGFPAHSAFEMALKMSLDARLERVYVTEIPAYKGYVFYDVQPRSLSVIMRRLLEEIPELCPEKADPAAIAATVITETARRVIRGN